MRPLSGNKILTILLLLCLALCAGRAEGADAIVIRSSQSARAMTPDNVSQSLDNWTAVWLDLLTSAGLTADTASESILETGTNGKLLILPNVSNLSDAQLTGLKLHLDSGYGALMTWATATRDENDGWRGWDFLNENTGGSIETSTLESGKSIALQMQGGLPGGCAIPPGYYLRMTPYVNPMYYIPGDSNAIGAYWASDGYKDTASTEENRLIGMVVRQRPTAGRIVWIGANLDGLHVDSLNRVMAIKWARELFFWLNGSGVAQVATWPLGYRCALMVHGDIEDQFDKVQRITSVFRRLNIPTTYNVLTNEASKYPSAMEAILSTKAQIGIHGDNHMLFSGQSYELQLQRLNKAAGYISLHGPRPTSFRPPELGYDDNTVKAAKAAGITHFLADDLPDRDYPRYIPEGARNPGAGMVFFPKGELDDYDLFVKVGIPEPSRMSDVMVKEFRRIYDERGLYKLNYHSQYLAIEHFPQTIETTLKRILAYPNVWPATAQEISQWVKQRDGLVLTSTSTSSTISVNLRNEGINPVRDAILRILPPRDVPADLMESKSISQNCEFDIVNGAMELKLPPMKPGSSFMIEVGASSGGGLSAKQKHIFRIIINVGAVIGGVLVLWFVFYLLFPKKHHYSQAQGPIKRNHKFHEKPIIDREYPVHSKSTKPLPEQPQPVHHAPIIFEPVPPPTVTASTVAEPALKPPVVVDPPRLMPHPAAKSPAVPESSRREVRPAPVEIENPKLEKLPTNPVVKSTSIQFDQVVGRIETEIKRNGSVDKAIKTDVPKSANGRSKSGSPMIISAATVDEITPALKPISKSLKVAPARRRTTEDIQHTRAHIVAKAPVFTEPLVESALSKITTAVIDKPMAPPPVAKPEPVIATAPPPVQKIPDTFLPSPKLSKPVVPQQPVGKNVFFSPTGSRSTASLPAKSPAQPVPNSAPQPQPVPMNREESEPMSDIPTGQSFVRTSMDVLKTRRPETKKNGEGEWR